MGGNAFDVYEPLWTSYAVTPLLSLGVTLVILLVLFGLYYGSVKKVKPNQAPNGFVTIMGMGMDYIKSLTVQIIGERHTKFTPYFLFLFIYLCTGVLISLIGFKEIQTSLVVPLFFALTTVIASQVLAVKYQKWSFFNKFLIRIKIKGVHIPVMIQPLEIISKLSPIISLTFRMWGNITAGSIIYALMWWTFGGIQGLNQVPPVGIFILGSTAIMPALFSYFTIFDAVIQAFVFTVLTISLWGREIQEGEEHELEKEQRKQEMTRQQVALLHKLQQDVGPATDENGAEAFI